eukprot:SAG31_NODE_1911_length_6936_cov_124.794501_4_plen_73_part_00
MTILSTDILRTRAAIFSSSIGIKSEVLNQRLKQHGGSPQPKARNLTQLTLVLQIYKSNQYNGSYYFIDVLVM